MKHEKRGSQILCKVETGNLMSKMMIKLVEVRMLVVMRMMINVMMEVVMMVVTMMVLAMMKFKDIGGYIW